MSTNSNLRLAAVNRHRKRLFGERSLKAYSTTPAEGEVVRAELAIDWCGKRMRGTTSDQAAGDAGAWQFHIAAVETWETTQAFMLSIVALTVGTRRWKVKKVEKPIGESLMWKLRGEIQ